MNLNKFVHRNKTNKIKLGFKAGSQLDPKKIAVVFISDDSNSNINKVSKAFNAKTESPC